MAGLRIRFILILALAVLPGAAVAQTPADSVVAVTRAGATLFRVNTDGKVGVGTATPDRRLTVNGTIGASDTIASAVGFKFPDGTVQTTAAAGATPLDSTSANTPSTLVARNAAGGFAAGQVTLDSLTAGKARLDSLALTGTGIRFADGSVQSTAATSATGTSTNTPNALVQRDGTGAFAAGEATLDSLTAGKARLDSLSVEVRARLDSLTMTGGASMQRVAADSLYVNARTSLGGGSVIVESNSALSSSADSVFTVRTGSSSRFRVQRDAGLLAVGTYTGTSSPMPVEGSGTRFFWYPGKASIRAGRINGTQWDDANIGLYSTAFGQDVRALGDGSLAVGDRATAANTGTVAIGVDVTATGANSVVLGQKASSSTGAGSPRLGTFVFGDRSTTVDTIHAEVTNSATWRVANGFRIYTASNLSTGFHVLPDMNGSFSWTGCSHTSAAISTSTCAWLSSGGTWTNSSDVNRKHHFENVAGEDVLTRLRTIPIRSWSYRAEPDEVRHLGPTAQDFRAAFGLGTNDRSIATVDADGVALAAAQALDARTTAQSAEIDRLQGRVSSLGSENEALRAEVARQAQALAELRARLERIEAALARSAATP